MTGISKHQVKANFDLRSEQVPISIRSQYFSGQFLGDESNDLQNR